MAKDSVIFRGSLCDARDRLFGNNEDVGRRLRLGISKRHYQVVFIDNRRRNLSCDDLFEQSFHARKLIHYQGHFHFLRLGCQALPQVFDDLVFQFPATATPTPSSGQALYAATQPRKAHNTRRMD